MDRYLTFTMALLLVKGTPTDAAVRRHILSGLSVLSFASIKSDVAYLIPRDVGWGLTLEDLADARFQYLRPIV